jgi:hypothetical protein
MTAKFFLTIILGTWINIKAPGSGQLPAPPVKPAVTPTKALAVKNLVINGNRLNHGQCPMSVGGPAKATKGTGAITGTAVAHKH